MENEDLRIMQYSKSKSCLNCNAKFYIFQQCMYIVFILQCCECKNSLDCTQKYKNIGHAMSRMQKLVKSHTNMQ